MHAAFAHVGHFATMLLFGLFVSVALACLTRRTAAERVRYAIRTFLLFILIGVAIAWIMYPISR